jgi:hypothetical protein
LRLRRHRSRPRSLRPSSHPNIAARGGRPEEEECRRNKSIDICLLIYTLVIQIGGIICVRGSEVKTSIERPVGHGHSADHGRGGCVQRRPGWRHRRRRTGNASRVRNGGERQRSATVHPGPHGAQIGVPRPSCGKGRDETGQAWGGVTTFGRATYPGHGAVGSAGTLPSIASRFSMSGASRIPPRSPARPSSRRSSGPASR